MPNKASVQREAEAFDAALEPLGMTVGERERRAHQRNAQQLSLFPTPAEQWVESAREAVRSRPLRAVGAALLIGLLLGR